MALLYEAIRQHILDEIRRGALRPGDRLPSELALAEQFDVSRITSKKALQLLEQDGIVTRSRGRGTFVATPPPAGDRAAPATTPGAPTDGATGATVTPASPARPGQPTRPARRVAFIVPDIDDIFGAELLRAIEQACADRGLELLFRRTVGDARIETDAITAFAASGTAGLIVFPIHGEYYNHELLRLVLGGFPVVLVDRFLPGIAVASVATDNVAAARALTGALLDAGHRDVAFVTAAPEHTSSIRDRWLGHQAALQARGIEPRRDHSLATLDSTLPGHSFADDHPADRDRIRAFLVANPGLTAFVACEYPIARLLDLELAALGRSGPGVTVACFDSPPDRLDGFPYLHVRQRQDEIGRIAVALLDEQIASSPGERPEPRHVAVPFDLVPATRP